MFEKIRQLLAPPTFADDEVKTRTARLLNTLLLSVIAASIIFTPILYITSSESIRSDPFTFLIGAGVAALDFGLWTALRRGYIRSTSLVVSVMIYAVVFANTAFYGGIRGNNTAGFALVIAVAGLLLGGRAALAFAGLSIIGGIILLVGESQSWLAFQQTGPGSLFSNWMVFAVNVTVIGLLLHSATNALNKALTLLNKRNRELQDAQVLLEDRIAARTQSLQLITEISRHLSTILNVDELTAEVVGQLHSTLNYYHAHIYVLDETGKNLVMRGSTGEAGKAMLRMGHKIPITRGLVGRAATENTVILVPDVTLEKEWLPNPLLPETKSEIAVPIALSGQILGVLDVQQNTVNSLTEEDAYLLQSVANQVAIALRNASLYEQAERQAARQTLINEINRRVQTAVDLDSVLQTTARELGQSLGVRRATVQLSRPQRGNGRIQENS